MYGSHLDIAFNLGAIVCCIFLSLLDNLLGLSLGSFYYFCRLGFSLGEQGFAFFLAFGQTFPVELVSKFLKLVLHISNDLFLV